MKKYKIFSRADILNTPLKLIKRGLMLDDTIKAIISDEEIEPGKMHNINGIVVSDENIENGFDETYFSTPLAGKKVYAPLEAYGGYLPTNLGKYELREKTDTRFLPENQCFFFKEVLFQDEQTIADLYANAHKYSYMPEMDAYAPLPAAGAEQNKIKYILSRDISTIGGDQYDRISDYGRLILFLLKKAYPAMTAEEQQKFAAVTAFAQEAEQLDDLLHRETLIQQRIKQAKENPTKYAEDYKDECPN